MTGGIFQKYISVALIFDRSRNDLKMGFCHDLLISIFGYFFNPSVCRKYGEHVICNSMNYTLVLITLLKKKVLRRINNLKSLKNDI